MMKAKGKETEEESDRRGSFEGPLVEAEYVFAKAVGAYSRSAVKEGSFKGRPIGNMKEQLAMRAGLEEKDRGKKYVIMIGVLRPLLMSPCAKRGFTVPRQPWAGDTSARHLPLHPVKMAPDWTAFSGPSSYWLVSPVQ